jgi:hypothetical protein
VPSIRQLRAGGKALLALVACAAAGGEFEGLFSGSINHPAIEYGIRRPHNAVSDLNVNLLDGTLRLTSAGPSGYLRATLEALHIPVESQIVVFSKTSLMRGIIGPRNPRSIFFNDSVAVAWVKGEPFVEIAAQDNQQGVIFYTLDQQPTDVPFFLRRDDCLQCHESLSSLGVPGMLARSVFPSPAGKPIRQLGDYTSDHRSPFDERWGGWYVTGRSAGLRHLGNSFFENAESAPPLHTTVDIASLEGKFDTEAYLSPYSDIVALLVFDHQMHMINLLTRAGWEARFAAYEAQSNQRGAATLLRDAAAEFVDYLLFIDEPRLDRRIQGTSGFQEKFSAQGPFDSRGRSLRQFDLEKRLMRFPCSYMIYAPAFDALPTALKDAIYERMWQILSGQEKTVKYGRLSLADRRAIVEILRETKTALPDYFQTVRQ